MTNDLDEAHLPVFRWSVDPAAFALERARERRRAPRVPAPWTADGDTGSVRVAGRDVSGTQICSEVGRRLLLAQLTWSDWVLRRVEKVSFISDRRLLRTSSVELRIPHHAPVLVGPDGDERWLIPLTLMRRRTLVNLDLADEDGNSLSLLGLRFTQQLDQSMLWAAAGGPDVLPGLAAPGERRAYFDRYVADAVSGTAEEVQASYVVLARALHESGRRDDTSSRQLFEAALDRLWHNFTLYVSLPVEQGRHRRLRVAFEERMRWKHQRPMLHRHDGDRSRHYVPMQDLVPRRETRAQSLAATSTRLRFLVPSAEACASYHFEFNAPTGISVDSADLVAGRPNDVPEDVPRVSCDSVTDPGHAAGLHAVEVPTGSLSRAQVDLRIPRRGWLSTMLAAMVVVTALMGCVAFYAASLTFDWLPGDTSWSDDQATNVVVLLVSTSAGAATFVAQQHPTDVMTRLVKALRLVGSLAIAVPATAAVLIVLMWRAEVVLVILLLLLTAGVTIGLLVVAAAWWAVRYREQRSDREHGRSTAIARRLARSKLAVLVRTSDRPSPWDMTHFALRDDARCRPAGEEVTTDQDHASGQEANRDDPKTAAPGPAPQPPDFDTCCRQLGFDDPAVGVFSAEGWLENYRWSDRAQRKAVSRLLGLEHSALSCPVQEPGHLTTS